MATRYTPPEQLAIFRDGDGMSVITRWSGNEPPPGYLGDMTSALPYQLLDSPRVLILGAGAGSDVLQAIRHGASYIDAVELDPNMTALLREEFAEFSGGLYAHPRVKLHHGEARGFSARSDQVYDLVQIGLLDSFAVSGSGVQSLNENYLYTTGAIRDYLRLLNPGGILAITRWLKVPPRDCFKLVNTVATSLREDGVADPGKRLAIIRGWNTVTLVVRNEALSAGDISAVKKFAGPRSFDTVYYPSMPPGEANRYNRLDRPWFHEGIRALLGPDAGDFTARYKFNIEAATDERPYFFNFFRWPVFFEAMSLRDRGGAALVEWGYLVPAATLIQAVLAGAVLILLPLSITARSRPVSPGKRAGAYFFLLGLAFLFVEIAFIQRFTLFLSHPLYAVAVVLAGFLVFAGIGSGLSTLLARRLRHSWLHPVHLAVGGIVAVCLVYTLVLPALFVRTMAFDDLTRIALSLALIAPLAVFMGMPFPLGLKSLGESAPKFIPWAWGINGFASVISAAIATLLAISFGFTFVLLMALLLYAAAAILAPTGRNSW
jgi:SAM-dependent methyltransferase